MGQGSHVPRLRVESVEETDSDQSESESVEEGNSESDRIKRIRIEWRKSTNISKLGWIIL